MNELKGRVIFPADGALGFDCVDRLSLDKAKEFVDRGYLWVARYIPYGDQPVGNTPDLTYAEANHILDAGLGLMPVQHVQLANTTIANGANGKAKGEFARNHAKECGFPPGVNVWLDLEGISNSFASWSVVDYCNAWFDQVAEWGYVPGIYIGFDSQLDSHQLFYSLKFEHYWRAQGNIPPVLNRGYQVIQTIFRNGYTIQENGIEIDVDVCHTDNLGGQIRCLHR